VHSANGDLGVWCIFAVQAKIEADQADAEVARRVAAEEQRAHERAVADQQAADWALAMGLQVLRAAQATPCMACPHGLCPHSSHDLPGDVHGDYLCDVIEALYSSCHT
jgi:hypothetical protein